MSQCPSCGEVKCPGMPDCGLLCIAGSPSPEHGGFHEKTVAIAKSALAELTTLRASLAEYQGAMRAQDQREDAAGVRCGVLRGYSGCDWPDAVAEEVLTQRASLEQAQKELAQQKLECSEHCKTVSAQLEAPKGSMFAKQISLLRAELEQVRGLLRQYCPHPFLYSGPGTNGTICADCKSPNVAQMAGSLPAPPSPSKPEENNNAK